MPTRLKDSFEHEGPDGLPFFHIIER
jgi:hypothetical protein